MKRMFALGLLVLCGACGAKATTNTPVEQTEGAQAAAAVQERFVCRQYDRGSEKLLSKTVVLKQTSEGRVGDGRPATFGFELFEGARVVAEQEASGKVEVEDVSFTFKSTDGKVGFNMFL